MTDNELLDQVWPCACAIDPAKLRLHDYDTTTVSGYATVDNDGTLVHMPWRSAFHFYSQSH